VKIFFAMDLIGGKAVRLVKGDFSQSTVYSHNPPETIDNMCKAGAKDFHIIDLDGAREGKRVHSDIISAIRKKVPGYMEVGGGIRTEEDIAYYSAMSIDGVIVGTRALQDRAFFKTLSRFRNIVLGLDLYEGRPMVKGWKETAALSLEEVLDLASASEIMAILFTSISKDGTLSGPDVDAIGSMQKTTNLRIIASGGVSSIEDLRRLKEMNVWAAIVGKAYYEGRIRIEEAVELAD
jgi:phosphoribosylformimino-5-aminoimidazole carboxamide ribotide isomerase